VINLHIPSFEQRRGRLLVSLTPRFSGVLVVLRPLNRFNGFAAWKWHGDGNR
jgi:hypothetical protein